MNRYLYRLTTLTYWDVYVSAESEGEARKRVQTADWDETDDMDIEGVGKIELLREEEDDAEV